MIKNLLIGNGVNIQHGGYDFSNAAIILRTLKCFKNPNFPKHIYRIYDFKKNKNKKTGKSPIFL